MALNVTFYKNFNKRENSTKQPAESALADTLTCTLKDGCDILQPSLDVLTIASNPAALGYNYAYIPAFGRYYNIDNWTWNLGVWTASLSVDVLASFKTEIGSLNKYVLRSSDTYNPDIPDNFYTIKNPWYSQTLSVPTPFSWSNRSYIIGFISAPAGTVHANTLGSTTYYLATEEQVITIIRWLLSDDFVNMITDPAAGITSAAIKDFMNPLDYIASLTLFPFEARSDSILPSIRPKIGWWDTTNWSNFPNLIRIDSLMKQFISNDYRVTIPTNNFAINKKDFLKYDPYTKYKLRLEPFGEIPLETNLMVGKEYLYTGYDIDLVTGACRLSLGTSLYGADLGTYNSIVGVPISLSQITTDIIGTATGIVGSIGQSVGNFLTGNIIGGIGNIAAGIGNAVNSIKPDRQTKGNNGTILAYNGVNNHQLIMQYCDCISTLNSQFGSPLCSYIDLGSHAGYLLCADGDHDIPGLEIEKQQISAYLTGGFFYE